MTKYNHSTTVINVCGQGSPAEASFDPDNNRCAPCPHVEAAVREFADDRVHYVFIPCDGSVVTGDGDIGCAGHKNRQGQREVFDFLKDKVAVITGW